MYKIMTPGPTQVAENVRMARSRECTNPDLDESFVEFYKETCEKISQLLHTKNETLILGGEGILGLEAACASLTEPGDKVLVLDNGIFVVFLVLYVLGLRRIVRPDQVHVVQRNNTSDVYGSSARDNKGNTYYEFPEWIPRLGVTVKKLPTAIFDVNLTEYDAYDKDRLPFLVDIKAFFRIFDFRVAASKVRDTKELEDQLKGIVQGAVRSLLAKEDLESIMSERAKYGKQFTQEVEEQLKEWGVVAVKNIELMDIKDSHNSEVIANIMKKKKSAIEMESRTTVANNMKQAKEAEIVANQAVALKEQDSVREVGLRQAQVQQEVGIANEQQMQKVQEQAKITAEKEMEVQRVREVKSAEITKQAAEVKAAQDKEVATINAETAVVKTEADKKVKVLNAEAEKQQVMLHAEANKNILLKKKEL